MNYRDRKGNTTYNTTSQDRFLKKLYGSMMGRAALKVLTMPCISRLGGLFLNSPFSICMIKPFVTKNHINMSDYVETCYHSYNEFFTRQIQHDKRKIDMEPTHFISPSDGKISVYPIDEHAMFQIKHSNYTVASLLKSKKLAKKYEGGYCAIIRLTVDNYHRYCYVDSAKKSKNYFIPGILHTVNPVALEHVNIYKENSREFTLLKTEHFGTVTQVEVGALMVGKINNHMQSGFVHKGFEKGMFEFGGSTIVLLVQKDKVDFDEDILKNTSEGYETTVLMGEKIGKKHD